MLGVGAETQGGVSSDIWAVVVKKSAGDLE